MILLDTSYLVALNHEKDMHHIQAHELAEKIAKGEYGEVYITDQIFSECATVLQRRLKEKKEVNTKCAQIKEIEMIQVENEIFESSWETFQKQDKGLSFVDCSSIACADACGIKHIATFDTDFSNIENLETVP